MKRRESASEPTLFKNALRFKDKDELFQHITKTLKEQQAAAASPALGDHGIFEPSHLKAPDLEVLPGRGDAHVVPLMGPGKTVDHRAVILVGGQRVYLDAKVRK